VSQRAVDPFVGTNPVQSLRVDVFTAVKPIQNRELVFLQEITAGSQLDAQIIRVQMVRVQLQAQLMTCKNQMTINQTLVHTYQERKSLDFGCVFLVCGKLREFGRFPNSR
jgi:hypothetical protein